MQLFIYLLRFYSQFTKNIYNYNKYQNQLTAKKKKKKIDALTYSKTSQNKYGTHQCSRTAFLSASPSGKKVPVSPVWLLEAPAADVWGGKASPSKWEESFHHRLLNRGGSSQLSVYHHMGFLRGLPPCVPPSLPPSHPHPHQHPSRKNYSLFGNDMIFVLSFHQCIPLVCRRIMSFHWSASVVSRRQQFGHTKTGCERMWLI